MPCSESWAARPATTEVTDEVIATLGAAGAPKQYDR